MLGIRKYFNIILVVFWMIFIFVMSSFDANESSNQSNFIVNIIVNVFDIKNMDLLSFIIRKLAHFIEYLILGILIYNLIKDYNYKVYLAIILCMLYAISDEVHQLFVPGRSCQIFDMIVDCLGSITGIYLFYVVNKFKFFRKII